MSSNDYLKYVTEEFVKYVDSTKEEREKKRKNKKAKQDPIITRMFGMIPLAFMVLVKNKKRRK